MWGTPWAGLPVRTHKRFTPTHVGNTIPSRITYRKRSVHPHACGEHHDAACVRTLPNGSPPRMWGTPPCPIRCTPHRRFTPTHVGNTTGRRSGMTPTTVHPHACGEHTACHSFYVLSFGSPPRMWGTLASQQQVISVNRFTPTHVGNTRPVSPCMGSCTVHPHACGEHGSIPEARRR